MKFRAYGAKQNAKIKKATIIYFDKPGSLTQNMFQTLVASHQENTLPVQAAKHKGLNNNNNKTVSEYSKPFFLPSSRSICEDPMIPGRRWQKKSRPGKTGSWSASSLATFRHLDCRTVGGSSLRTDCTVVLRKALSSYTVINDDCGNCLKRTTYFPTRNVFFPWAQCIVYTAVSRLVMMFSALCAYPAFTACTNVRSTIS